MTNDLVLRDQLDDRTDEQRESAAKNVIPGAARESAAGKRR